MLGHRHHKSLPHPNNHMGGHKAASMPSEVMMKKTSHGKHGKSTGHVLGGGDKGPYKVKGGF
jgi:hypothetical protein